MYHEGTMVTRSDNCLFICIPQEQYANILNKVIISQIYCNVFYICIYLHFIIDIFHYKGEENIKCIYDEHGAKIRYEEYRICDGGKKKGHVIIKVILDNLIEFRNFISLLTVSNPKLFIGIEECFD